MASPKENRAINTHSAQTAQRAKRARTQKQQKILEVKTENPTLTQSQVAALVGCERSMVSRTWSQYGVEKKDLELFKANRSDVFDTLSYRIICSITEDDIKKASLLQRMSSLGILYDKMRVERGLGDGSAKPLVHIHLTGSDAHISVDNGRDNAIDVNPLMIQGTCENV